MRSASSCFSARTITFANAANRRIAQPFAKFDLFPVEAFVILLRGKPDRVVIRIQSLNDDAGRAYRRVRRARRPESEAGKLRSAARKSGMPQTDIRKHHPDQRYVRDVVALGNHLRADQDVDFAIAKAVQDSLKRTFAACAIAIETRDARRGQIVDAVRPPRAQIPCREIVCSRCRTVGKRTESFPRSRSSGKACGGRAGDVSEQPSSSCTACAPRRPGTP